MAGWRLALVAACLLLGTGALANNPFPTESYNVGRGTVSFAEFQGNVAWENNLGVMSIDDIEGGDSEAFLDAWVEETSYMMITFERLPLANWMTPDYAYIELFGTSIVGSDSFTVDVFMELSETPLPAGLNNFNISARTRSASSNVPWTMGSWSVGSWNHFDITDAFAGLMSSVTYSRECSTAVNVIFRINPATVSQSRLGFRIGWQGAFQPPYIRMEYTHTWSRHALMLTSSALAAQWNAGFASSDSWRNGYYANLLRCRGYYVTAADPNTYSPEIANGNATLVWAGEGWPGVVPVGGLSVPLITTNMSWLVPAGIIPSGAAGGVSYAEIYEAEQTDASAFVTGFLPPSGTPFDIWKPNSFESTIMHGVPAGNAYVVVDNQPDDTLVAFYAPGDTLADGSTASGIRIGTLFGEDTPPALSVQGMELVLRVFDAVGVAADTYFDAIICSASLIDPLNPVMSCTSELRLSGTLTGHLSGYPDDLFPEVTFALAGTSEETTVSASSGAVGATLPCSTLATGAYYTHPFSGAQSAVFSNLGLNFCFDMSVSGPTSVAGGTPVAIHMINGQWRPITWHWFNVDTSTPVFDWIATDCTGVLFCDASSTIGKAGTWQLRANTSVEARATGQNVVVSPDVVVNSANLLFANEEASFRVTHIDASYYPSILVPTYNCSAGAPIVAPAGPNAVLFSYEAPPSNTFPLTCHFSLNYLNAPDAVVQYSVVDAVVSPAEPLGDGTPFVGFNVTLIGTNVTGVSMEIDLRLVSITTGDGGAAFEILDPSMAERAGNPANATDLGAVEIHVVTNAETGASRPVAGVETVSNPAQFLIVSDGGRFGAVVDLRVNVSSIQGGDKIPRRFATLLVDVPCAANTTGVPADDVGSQLCLGCDGLFDDGNEALLVCPGGASPPIVPVCFFNRAELPDYDLVDCGVERSSDRFPCSRCGGGIGGKNCTGGYTGDNVCNDCAANYYYDDETGQCELCSAAALVFIIVGLAFMVVVAAVMVKLARKSTAYFTSLSVGASFLQVIAILVKMPLAWPAFVVRTFELLSIFNMDINFFQPQCAFGAGGVDPVVIWYTKLLLPIVFLAIFLLFMAGVVAYHSLSRCCLERCVPAVALSSARRYLLLNAIVNAFFSVLALLFLSVTSTAIDVFRCDPASGMLAFDPSIECYSPEWGALLPAAIIGILLYGIGIPLAFLLVLRRYRSELHREVTIVRFGLVYRRYKRNLYLWELAVLARKVGITLLFLLSSALSAPTQAILAISVLVVALVAQAVLRPYLSRRVNLLETFHLACGVVVLGAGLAFYYAADALDDALTVAVGILVLVLVFSNCAAIAVVVLVEIRHQYLLRRRGVGGGYASDLVEAKSEFFAYDIEIESQKRLATNIGHAMRLHIRSSRRLALHAELYDQAGISLGPDQVAVHSGVAVAAKGDGATAKEHDWYVDAVFRRVQHYDIVLHALDCEAEGDDPAEVDYYTDHRFRQVLSFGVEVEEVLGPVDPPHEVVRVSEVFARGGGVVHSPFVYRVPANESLTFRLAMPGLMDAVLMSEAGDGARHQLLAVNGVFQASATLEPGPWTIMGKQGDMGGNPVPLVSYVALSVNPDDIASANPVYAADRDFDARNSTGAIELGDLRSSIYATADDDTGRSDRRDSWLITDVDLGSADGPALLTSYTAGSEAMAFPSFRGSANFAGSATPSAAAPVSVKHRKAPSIDAPLPPASPV